MIGAVLGTLWAWTLVLEPTLVIINLILCSVSESRSTGNRKTTSQRSIQHYPTSELDIYYDENGNPVWY